MFITCTGSRPLPTSQLIYKFHANMFLSLPAWCSASGSATLICSQQWRRPGVQHQQQRMLLFRCCELDGRLTQRDARAKDQMCAASWFSRHDVEGWRMGEEKKRYHRWLLQSPPHFCIVDSNQTLITSLLSPLGPSENKLFFRCYIKLAHTRS